MTAVGELVLVLGLLVSAHCEVRARDPEVEEEEELGGQARGGGGGGGGGLGMGGIRKALLYPHPQRVNPRPTETPPPGERDNQSNQPTGNWCPFPVKHVVTTAVACGTQQYTIKSQEPCSTPGCHMVIYKLATRPIYTQRQTVIETVQWRCCLGHGGINCEDTVPNPQLEPVSWILAGRSDLDEPERAPLHVRDVNQQQGDPNREQNDHQASVSELHDTSYPSDQHNDTHPTEHPGDARNHHHHHSSHQTHQQHRRHDPDKVDATAIPYPEAPAALPVHQVMDLVMVQLKPVLDGFNRTLGHLNRQVGDLARDVAQLKSSRRGAELQPPVLPGPELDEAAEERFETKLDEVYLHIREVQRQVASQRAEMVNGLHSQHSMLHYNLTVLKTDIDMKLKRHQKMLQVSLQAMNTTLSELKLDQDQTTEMQPEDLTPFQPPPRPQLPQHSDSSALWEAIKRLDDMVVNNTVKVDGLMEDMEVTSGKAQQLTWSFKELEKQLNQTARSSRVLFMETGLEVEAAKVAVLDRVEDLARNLTRHDKHLQDVDVDMDYLFDNIKYHNNLTGDCHCKVLKAALAQLEWSVANVTALANRNRLALEEDVEGGVEQWGGDNDWEPAVEALKHALHQVTESLALDQSRTRTLNHSLAQLSSLVKVNVAEVSDLKERDKKVKEKIQLLFDSFNSLLTDVIRHNDLLELLLGEEVLEFVEWPVQDQEANSIPALKEKLWRLQEQVRGHNLSITSLLSNKPGGKEEALSDQPFSPHLLPDDWPSGGVRRSDGGVPARERQLLLHPDGRPLGHVGDGSDLWNLEKRVEELGQKVLGLAEKPCPCPSTSTEREAPSGGVDAKLQAEVTWLKRGLEEHLRVFKNVFSNADVLAGSDATLELDKLWQLVKTKDGKKEKKRGAGREASGRGANHRNRRDSSGVLPAPSGLSDAALLFAARSPLSVSNGVIAFEASLNQGQLYSDTGTFTAPVDGIYLFILTLDLRPGPAHVVLRRGSGEATVSLHRQEVTEEAAAATGVGLLLLREGEEVRLELRGGALAGSEDNVFTGMLLRRTT